MPSGSGVTHGVDAVEAMTGDRSPSAIPWPELLLILTSPMFGMAAILNFAPMLPMVERDLGLTHSWAGILISSTTLLHMLLMLPGGQVSEAIGAKRALVLGQVIVGVGILLGAAAPDLTLLLASRVLLGVGTGLSFVPGFSMVNSMAPAGQRAKVQGVFGAGGNLGVVLVLVLSQPLVSLGGWRGVLLVEGSLAIVVAAMYAVRLTPSPPSARADSVPWGNVLRRRAPYLLGLANALTYGAFVGAAAWTTTLLWQTRGMDLGMASSLTAAMAATAVAGRALGGALSAGREKQVMVFACLATGLCALMVPLAPGVAIPAVILVALGWFSSVSFGSVFASVPRFSDASSLGRSFGIVGIVSNLASATFPPLMGYALDATGSFVVSFGLVSAAAIAGAVVLALALPNNGQRVDLPSSSDT